MKKRMVALMFGLALTLCACTGNSNTGDKVSLDTSLSVTEVPEDFAGASVSEKESVNVSESEDNKSDSANELEDISDKSKDSTESSADESETNEESDPSGDKTQTNDHFRNFDTTDYKECIDILTDYVDGKMSAESSDGLFCVLGQAPIYNPSFAIIDVNNDGKKDLLVNGPIGIRAVEETQVYLASENGVLAISFNGYLNAVFGDILEIASDDHDVTATEIYHTLTGVRFNGLENASIIYDMSTKELWGNAETGEEYTEAVIDYEFYEVNGNQATKDEFENYVATLIQSDRTEFYSITAENIEKYCK